jgi:hypothetical protein
MIRQGLGFRILEKMLKPTGLLVLWLYPLAESLEASTDSLPFTGG